MDVSDTDLLAVHADINRRKAREDEDRAHNDVSLTAQINASAIHRRQVRRERIATGLWIIAAVVLGALVIYAAS
jgi:hypothetical protein